MVREKRKQREKTKTQLKGLTLFAFFAFFADK